MACNENCTSGMSVNSVQNQQQGCLHVCRNCEGNFHNHVVLLQASFDPLVPVDVVRFKEFL